MPSTRLIAVFAVAVACINLHYEHPIEVGGAVFTPLVLSPYGGWHGSCGNEQWTSRTTCSIAQSGD